METTKYKLESNLERAVDVPKECYDNVKEIVDFYATKPLHFLSDNSREINNELKDYLLIPDKNENLRIRKILDDLLNNKDNKKEPFLKDELFLMICSNYLYKKYFKNREESVQKWASKLISEAINLYKGTNYI